MRGNSAGEMEEEFSSSFPLCARMLACRRGRRKMGKRGASPEREKREREKVGERSAPTREREREDREGSEEMERGARGQERGRGKREREWGRREIEILLFFFSITLFSVFINSFFKEFSKRF